jgi:hypothetical protein
MENLLILVVFVALSGLSSWLQKRGRHPDSPPGAPPGPRPPSPSEPQPVSSPEPAFDWEAELKRWLTGEGGKESAPVLVEEMPAPMPSAPRAPAPVVISPPPLIAPKAAVPVALEQATAGGVAMQHPALVRTAVSAKRIPPPKTGPRTIYSRFASDRASLRKAFIASLVFSPPKALEEPRG